MKRAYRDKRWVDIKPAKYKNSRLEAPYAQFELTKMMHTLRAIGQNRNYYHLLQKLRRNFRDEAYPRLSQK